MIPHKELWFRGRFTDAAPANKASICAGFAYGFDKLQFFKTHVRPHYLILNAGLKLLHKSRESWDENLQDFYKRKGIRADAWAILRYVRILCQMWTASTPPPFEKRSVKRQKVDNPLGPRLVNMVDNGDAIAQLAHSSLPITPAPGIPKTPERRKGTLLHFHSLGCAELLMRLGLLQQLQSAREACCRRRPNPGSQALLYMCLQA